MTALPIALHGERTRAVVVGAGGVGARKALALLDAGAHVRVIAPEISAVLDHAANARLEIIRAPYDPRLLAEATLVVAATDSRELNAAIATDARAAGKLVNVSDSPDEGDFVTMAIHRAGELTIAVSTGGVPTAAARIRDTLAERFDGRYDRALTALRRLRTQLQPKRRDDWQRATTELIGDDFCKLVESGGLPDKVAAWR